MQATHERVRRGGLLGPLLLIAVGIIFLLNNIGLLDWGVWEIVLRLWPVFLIAIGLDLVLGRRMPWLAPVVGAVLLVVLGTALWRVDGWSLSPTRLDHQTTTQPIGDASRAEIHIDSGVGVLRIGALAEEATLLEGNLDVARGERVLRDYAVRDGTAYVTLRSEMQRMLPWGRWGSDHVWDLKFNRDLPTALRLNTGVGEAMVDLADLHITQVQVNTGVGRTTLTLPAKGRVEADINGGVGETIITIPPDMAVRIEAKTGLGSIDVPATFHHNDHTDDVYTSPGYDTATHRIDMKIKGGIGNISIRHSE